jgi:thiamine pyrophosphokinase
MRRKRAIIFANGNLSDTSNAINYIKKDDLIVCADGGLEKVYKLGIIPSAVIGDLDSAEKHTVKKYNNKTKFIKYPQNKDFSDLELALKYCLNEGCTEVVLFGIWGNRIDHFLSSIFLLQSFRDKDKWLKLTIVEERIQIFFANGYFRFRGKKGDLVSIIPISGNLEGICTKGLIFPLNNETLKYGSTRGISNILKSKTAEIKIQKGTALIFLSPKLP